MCASVQPRVSHALSAWFEPVDGRWAARVLIPGIAVGALSLLAFGSVHAWLIVPIWTRLAGGIPSAMLAAVALAWAFDSGARTGGRSATPIQGAVFGVYMFATLLPASAVDAVMRLNGMRLGDTVAGMIGAVALFAVAGSLAGRAFSRQRSTALAFAVAAVALMIVAGGPLPIVRSPAGLGISIGVGCICVAAGVGIASVRSFAATFSETDTP